VAQHTLVPPTRFGELLHTRRKILGLTLTELAKGCAIDNGNLSRIERGERMPPKLTPLLRLLDALKIEKESPAWNEFLSTAARERLEPIELAGVTYLAQENPLHGLSEDKEKGPEQVSLIEAALEIGRLSASCGIKKITVEDCDGSEYFYYIREQR
jgi:transcriptional regulator with XRE-family HTH domain